MGHQKKNLEADEAPGAPEWMVTFSDCMTLLLTFFVLLLTFSSFDNRVFKKLKVIYSTGLTTITPMLKSDRDSLVYLSPVMYTTELDKGSEQPTLSNETEEGLRTESGPASFSGGIVFLFASDKIFWAKGVAISIEGREAIDKLASFLKEVPHRIVISENGPTNNQNSESLGLQRSWAIMNYLSTRQNIGKNRFNISAVNTVDRETQNKAILSQARYQDSRILEIVLLTRSLYN